MGGGGDKWGEEEMSGGGGGDEWQEEEGEEMRGRRRGKRGRR